LPACREDTAPTEPESGPEPALAITSSPALSFHQVAAGDAYTCGLTGDDLAYCWGMNHVGQLGDGTTDNSPIPVPVSGGLRFRQMDAGVGHACGVTTDDRAYCWGSDDFGQLGNGAKIASSEPVAVVGGHRFRQVSAGQYHTCGITTDDRVFCWGYNKQGQVGDGSGVHRWQRPVRVAIDRKFRLVSAGALHTCGVTTYDRAFCWGDGSSGQIGDGKTLTRLTPRAVAGGLDFREVAAGETQRSGGYHSCGVTTDDRAYCWGGNFDGQLGDGTTSQRLKPVAVAGGLLFGGVSPGGDHTCGVSTGNLAYCWGYDYYGQLGDGGPLGIEAPNHLSPFAVVGGLPFAAMSTGRTHTCGVTVSGEAYCWGGNTAGQLGNGVPDFATSTPVAVAGPG
jgi:alpha-tubulin suppressor-like RCC1 family protein